MAKDKFQELRRSQFIFTYGPGALIEGINGPRLMPSLEQGFGKKHFEYYKNKNAIPDIRMGSAIKNEMQDDEKTIKFFKLPSNAEENMDNQGLYNTYVFPVWKICRGDHNGGSPILYDSSVYGNCPNCGNDSKTYVRFVCACPDGHLDEVPWNFAVHKDSSKKCEGSDKFYWNGNTTNLKDITITCPKCGATTNMQKIYSYKEYECDARRPESEYRDNKNKINKHRYNVSYSKRIFKKGGCGLNARVVPRQSTSLRVAKTLTLIQIPPYEDEIIKTIQHDSVISLMEQAIDFNMDEETFRKFISKYCKVNAIKQKILTYLKNNDDGYEKIIGGYKKLNNNFTLEDILKEEFEVLKGKATDKYENFIKGPFKSFTIDTGIGEFPFKVCSINKIQTLTAQYGYQRVPVLKKEGTKFENSQTIFIGEHDTFDDTEWYPVFEGFGEGIFITSDKNPLKELDLDDISQRWIENKPTYKVDKRPEVKEPLFVWWHSLAHALIRTLSFTSGYSIASIRERVFIDNSDADPSKHTGGILIYTTNPGQDAGMGGLVKTRDTFDNIINDAIEDVKMCSYDPLCITNEVSHEKVNGAACIYCLLLPETSCEHNNMWLDRHMLLGR